MSLALILRRGWRPFARMLRRAAQPLILDVNGDNYQDVIIGTLHGEIFIPNGKPTLNQGEGRLLLGSPFHTFRSSDSLWPTVVPNVSSPNVQEFQYEEVRGLGVAPLRADAPDHAILLVTSGRSGITYPSQVGGHAILFDLGPGSWNTSANTQDWPQFQQNAQRTGTYPG